MCTKREMLEALVWLAKWFNGRRARLYERLADCEAKIVEQLIQELDQTADGMARLQLCGFKLIVEYNEAGVSILSVELPEILDGNQLALFDTANDAQYFE